MGGRVISKSLEKSLGLVGGKTNFFYNGFGPNTGDYWRAFEGFLSDNEGTVDNKLVLDTANDCFFSLKQYLDSSLSQKNLEIYND